LPAAVQPLATPVQLGGLPRVPYELANPGFFSPGVAGAISIQKTSNTIIFPVPMEMMTSFFKRDEKK
jgi:hypothetical protein